ncbi:DUF3618 domain-containing protein [Streptomyces sp. NPDC054840]
MTSQFPDEPTPRRSGPRQPPQPTADEPSPEELRDRIEHTRDRLGCTVEALAAKADVTAQAREKTAAVKEQATRKAAVVTGQIRDRAEHVAHLAAERAPDPVLDKAGRAAPVAVGAALFVFLVVRANRRRHR